MRVLFLLLLLAWPARADEEAPTPPAEHYRLADRDAERLPRDRQVQARYLTLYHMTHQPKRLERWTLNGLWWHRNLDTVAVEDGEVAFRPVAPGLWRIYLDEVGWKKETWEKLLEVPEPFFHVQIDQKQVGLETVEVEKEVEELTGRRMSYDGGKTWIPETRRVRKKVREQKKTDARFVAASPGHLKDALHLIATTQTQVPVARLDWFIRQTAIQEGRKVGYYDFLNLGDDEKDFQKLVGADVKLAQALRRERKAVVGISSVTLNSREIEQYDAITGRYFRTRDFAASTDKKNPLRLLDGDAEADATEQYGFKNDGMLVTWLGNAKGKRQNFAPDNIASNGATKYPDRRVHAGKACFECHLDGLQPVDNWAARIHDAPFRFLSKADYAKEKRLRQIYLADMQRAVREANEYYAARIKWLTGLKPHEVHANFVECWNEDVEKGRTLAQAAWELGITEKQWREDLERASRLEKRLDPVLAGLLQGLTVRTEHWEEIYPLALDLMRVR